MRYLAAEKLEIIRLVEQSHLPVRRTLRHLDIPPATFYRWCERFQAGGTEALADRPSRPDRVWNRIPEAVRGHILELALAEPDLSPRELAVRFTDQHRYFVSEASVYRLLKAHDLVTSPAFILVKAANADHAIDHVRGAPCHPQTQGKIERWHQTLKNRILLENYYLPGALEAQVGAFIAHYNHQRYHESLHNLTPADVYFGHGQTILLDRERIKRQTIHQRRLFHRQQAA